MEENIEIDQEFGIPGKSKYPFADLKVKGAFLTDDLTKYATLRSAASRQGEALKRKFSVRRVTKKDKKTGIVTKKIAVIRLK